MSLFDSLRGICCICGHSLDAHLEEIKWYRCRSLGSDYLQCECRIFKDANAPLEEYDYVKRKFEHAKKLKYDLMDETRSRVFLSKGEEAFYFTLNFLDKNPEILGGKLVVKGTRIVVALVYELADNGCSFEKIFQEYPMLKEGVVRNIFEFREYLEELLE